LLIFMADAEWTQGLLRIQQPETKTIKFPHIELFHLFSGLVVAAAAVAAAGLITPLVAAAQQELVVEPVGLLHSEMPMKPGICLVVVAVTGQVAALIVMVAQDSLELTVLTLQTTIHHYPEQLPELPVAMAAMPVGLAAEAVRPQL
jgi:hypothetical protein